jgi:hypothetical protein
MQTQTCPFKVANTDDSVLPGMKSKLQLNAVWTLKMPPQNKCMIVCLFYINVGANCAALENFNVHFGLLNVCALFVHFGLQSCEVDFFSVK